MDTVRLGVVGLGNMGVFHAGTLAGIAGATLTAVCDRKPEQAAEVAAKHGAAAFSRFDELLQPGRVDAVLVATPHTQHAQNCLDAFKAGLHVLCEKPIAVSIGDARRVRDAAAANTALKFGVMLQLRTASIYRKLRELIADGELGEITRITWLVTDWFRTWSYYASGGWRATWKGEGGGVLINQCPHNLDMIQWATGLSPSRVTAVASIGKTHPIEVEDEVSAILEYPNGAIGHFVTTTGEAPGTNRLEIGGDRGKIVAENGKLLFTRTRKSVREIRETSPEPFAIVETWPIDIAHANAAADHKIITQNFVNAILKNEPLIAPGADGVKALELGNAIQMAGLTRQAVDLPLDAAAFDAFLRDMERQHGGRKKLETRASAPADMSASFSRL